MNKIYVGIKEPGKKVRFVWISGSLENLQKTVGGYIEVVRLSRDLILIVNEEGKLLGLPENFTLMGDRIAGTAIFAGVKREDIVSIPKCVKEIFPQLFPQCMKGEDHE